MTRRRDKTEIGTPLVGDDGDPLIGSVLDDRYRLLRALGEGQMSQVYVAEQISMSRNVAVKVLRAKLAADQTLVARFRQEVEAVSRLHSPHTIQFHDFGEAAGGLYIVMELLAGENLRDRLVRDTRIPPEQVLLIVAEIASSLQEAHEAGVMHRDLKPENIHFCVDHATPLRPFIKVLDFGLAKLEDPEEESPTLTGQRRTVGTPAYIAPERIVEGRPVDNRSDLYSLAVIIFEMLTGELPYSEKTPMKMALAHVNEPIPSVQGRGVEIPPRVDDFFQQALAKNPADRPEQATALATALGNALGFGSPFPLSGLVERRQH